MKLSARLGIVLLNIEKLEIAFLGSRLHENDKKRVTVSEQRIDRTEYNNPYSTDYNRRFL